MTLCGPDLGGIAERLLQARGGKHERPARLGMRRGEREQGGEQGEEKLADG